MRSKKPLGLVFVLTFLVGGRAQPAEDPAPIALPAVAVSVSQAGQTPTSSAFRVVREETATFATVLADGPFNYIAYGLDSPPRYVVDMVGLLVSPEQVQSVEVNSRAVRVVRLFQADQGSGPARLVVELNQAAACKTFRNAVGTGLLIRVDEAQEALTLAAGEPVLSTSPVVAVETVAWLPEAEPEAALSPTYSGYGTAEASGEAAPAVSLAPEIPAQANLPLSSLTEPSLPLTSSAGSTLATEEQPEVISIAPDIPQPIKVPPPPETVSPASAANATPAAVVEQPPPLATAAAVPPAPLQRGPEAEASLSPEGALWQPVSPPAAQPPVLLAMAPPPTPSGAVVKVALVEEPRGGTSSSEVPLPGTVSVDFVNTPLADVFKSFAFQTGKGILVHQDVQGTATLQLQDLPLDSAMELIASMYDLSVRRVGDVYLVMPKETVEAAVSAGQETRRYALHSLGPDRALAILQEMLPGVKAVAVREQNALILMGLETDLRMAVALLEQVDRGGVITDSEMSRVFALQYASPDAVAEALRSALPALTISVEAQLRAVTVRGSAADVGTAEQMVRQLDRAAPDDAPMIPTAVKIQHVPVASLAAKLQDLLPRAKVSYDEALNAIFISGIQPDIQAAMSIIQALDVAPTAGAPAEAGTEVIIRDLEYASPQEAKTFLESASKAIKVETSPDTDRVIITAPKGMFGTVKQLVDTFDVPPKEVVIEALVTDMSRSLSKQLGFAWDFGGTAGFQIIAPATTEGIGFPTVRRGLWNITSVISAIEGDTTSKLLARPRIRTIDAKEASILIGERILFQVATITAGTVTFTIREERVGIGLTILPRITRDGHVLLTVHPEVSTITGFNPQGYPNIATRETDGTVLLKDGEMLVIGGLIREEEIRSLVKVPILSEIPLLGEIFKRRTKTLRPTEVLIFVTPHIVARGEEL